MSESESSEEENHIRYGTPLDAYDEDDVPSKKKLGNSQSDQYALDEQGRRRFHGAFTGGFTAGHGNTVAAPEGWAPATFRSSRTEKAASQNLQQRPEDFMDEEDRGQFGIAPRQINTTGDFTSNKRRRQKNEPRTDGPIPGVPVLEILLQPAHETVAIKMLKSMGWRPGQGTGERLTAKEKKRHSRANRKVYGCYVPEEFRPPTTLQCVDEPQQQSSEDGSSSEEEYSDVLFAPDDFEPYLQRPKNDLFGLGYEGMSRRSVLGSISGKYGDEAGFKPNSHLQMLDKGQKVSIRGQAFGVGALEEEDEDIYAREDMSNYDFTLGGDRKAKLKNKPTERNTTGHVLVGFVAASKQPAPKKLYPPPILPKDYQPGIGGVRKSRFAPISETEAGQHVKMRERGLGRHELSASERGELLGELSAAPLPNWKKQVFDKDIPAVRTPEDILAAVTGRSISFVGNAREGDEYSTVDDVKEVTGPGVFKPFVSDPEKQERYEKFVQMKDGRDGGSAPAVRASKLQQWEQERETKEFEQAARLYRPLTGSMNERFVRPSDVESSSIDPLTSSSKTSIRYGATEDQVEAAANKMYGKLTRTEKEWRPETLLCKRFNVPDPYGQRSSEMSVRSKRKAAPYSIFEFLEAPLHNKESFLRDQAAFSGENTLNKPSTTTTINKTSSGNCPKANENSSNNSKLCDNIEVTESSLPNKKNKRMTVTDLFLIEKEKEKESRLQKNAPIESKRISDESEKNEDTIEKFDKIDLYKAIFLSDSDSDGESSKSVPVTVTTTSTVAATVVPINVERNKSPPRGIFAGIDFDQMNSWRNRSDDNNVINGSTDNVESGKISTSKMTDSIDIEQYGPKLPDKPVFRPRMEKAPNKIDDILSVDSSSSESWVETDKSKSVEKIRKNRKGKKSHREKHRKRNHKGKSKKHKS